MSESNTATVDSDVEAQAQTGPTITAEALQAYYTKHNTREWRETLSITLVVVSRDLWVDPYGNIYVNEGPGVVKPYTAATLPEQHRLALAARLPRPATA